MRRASEIQLGPTHRRLEKADGIITSQEIRAMILTQSKIRTHHPEGLVVNSGAILITILIYRTTMMVVMKARGQVSPTTQISQSLVGTGYLMTQGRDPI
jgi:hypothetical protein